MTSHAAQTAYAVYISPHCGQLGSSAQPHCVSNPGIHSLCIVNEHGSYSIHPINGPDVHVDSQSY